LRAWNFMSASEGSAMHHRNDDDNFSRRAREWDRDREYSPPYGQREPYTTSGSGGGSYGASGYGEYPGEGQGGPQHGRDAGRTYSPQDYSRDIGRDYGRDYGNGPRREAAGRRDEWGPSRRDAGGYRQSRYSESQYGQGQHDRDRDWAGGRGNYSSSPDWDSPQSAQRYGREQQRYGGGNREAYPADEYGYAQRYGVGYSGSQGAGHDRPLGDERFNLGDQPRYFGTGYYGEGTSAFGGGFGEERWHGQPTSQGRFREAEQGSRFYGGSSEHERGGHRPGLLKRIFGTGPKGYQRSDERLREDISERLMQAGDVDSSEVTVNVVSGKVTLEGTVPDRYMKHHIEDLADACPGVQDIDNRIRVERGTGRSGGTSDASYGSGTGSAQGTSPVGAGAPATGGYGTSSSTGAAATGTAGGTSSASPPPGRTTRRDS
jgi:hypothetical protein